MKSYIINSVDEGIVATIAHCQPITTKPDNVDVSVPVRIIYNTTRYVSSGQLTNTHKLR